MGLEFVPLADLGDDAEAICSRLLDVAAMAAARRDDDASPLSGQGQEDAIEGHQDAQTAVPWHVRVGRRLVGDRGTWKP